MSSQFEVLARKQEAASVLIMLGRLTDAAAIYDEMAAIADHAQDRAFFLKQADALRAQKKGAA